MSMDFTVIQPVRQRFGGEGADLMNPPDSDQDAPAVGESEKYVFSCPNVDPTQWAVLQFQSIGVSGFWDILRINDVNIPGGLQPGGAHHTFQGTHQAWKAHTMLVPQGVLRADSNVLHIAALGVRFQDEFIIDNIVIFYKIAERVGPSEPGGVIREPVLEVPH